MNANDRNLVVVGGAIAVDLLFWDGEVRLAGGGELPMWLPVVTTVVAHACLLDRRTRPVAVFVVQAAFAMVSVVVPLWQPVAGLLVATFAIAANTGSRVARWGWLAAVPLIAHAVTQSLWFNSKWVGLLQAGTLYLVAGAACWVAGRRVRARGGQLRAWHAEQERLHTEATLDERLALARELHDGVANTITAVLVQAAAARASSCGDPDALHRIEATARRAMHEIQTTLRLMPHAAGRPSGPSLDDLPNLLDLGRAAGLDVVHTSSGTPRNLDPAASAAAYRAVQEGITNTLKYAPAGTRCVVALEWRPDELVIGIVDHPRSGRACADLPATNGRGLAGLADRLAGLGGAVESGAHESGFRLEARLPVGVR